MNRFIAISKYLSGIFLFLIFHLSLISVDYLLRICKSKNQIYLIKFGINYTLYCVLLIIFFSISHLFLYRVKIRYLKTVKIKILVLFLNIFIIAIIYLLIQFWYVINTGIDSL